MTQWPHAPIHLLDSAGMYMVTAGTYRKQHLFNEPKKLDLLQEHLLTLSHEYGWKLQSWAIFSNHYHFIGSSPVGASNLKKFVSQLHSHTARTINQWDNAPGRQVWYQFWDSHITFQKSYFARLNYVNNNPVKHGLVKLASEYEHCSAAWFEQNTTSAFYGTVKSFDWEKVTSIFDDF